MWINAAGWVNDEWHCTQWQLEPEMAYAMCPPSISRQRMASMRPFSANLRVAQTCTPKMRVDGVPFIWQATKASCKVLVI
jgi:hypothetical protein